MLKAHDWAFELLQKLIDLILVSLCWWLAYYIRFLRFENAQQGLAPLFLKLLPILMLLTYLSFEKNGLYRSQRFNSRLNEILAVFKANSIASVIFIIILYFFADARLSRLTIAIYFVFSSFVLIFFRIIVRNFLRSMRRKGRNLRHLILVGDGPQMETYINTVQTFKDAGIRFKVWIDSGSFQDKFPNIPKSTGSLKDALGEPKSDGVVIGYSGVNSAKVEKILKEYFDSLIDIQVLPDLTYSFIGHKIEDFAGIPILLVNHPKLGTLDTILKRSIDLTIALPGLILISPLLLLISALVKLSSSGPIFYGQERVGLDGNNFTMWKFRTMKMALENEDKNVWDSKNNPRKTKFGEILRKTSLDELPQLINVLMGDMSIVGPRPERPYFVEKFKTEIPAYMLRHKMKAGITGWAQISGWRGDTSIKKRIEFDIFYIKNWSLWLDVKIIFLTFWKGFFNKNAY